jgi:aminomethyltransferase
MAMSIGCTARSWAADGSKAVAPTDTTYQLLATVSFMRTTPFHDRLASLNETHLWEHWAGYLSAVKYQHSATVEYYAIRDAVGVFDTSPLFKYRVTGGEAAEFLSSVMVRDVAPCGVGEAQYNVWCNDAGYTLEDGVILRVAENEYWLSTAGRNLRYLSQLVGSREVAIEDISADYGMLAIQGPHSLSTLAQLSPDVAALRYFGVTNTEVAAGPVTVSRTGFTGDLGYELWIRAADCARVLDVILDAGGGYNIVPIGARALGMARLEAGLLLLGTDFESARYAWTDAQRETPIELGLGWMMAKNGQRRFIGEEALERARSDGSSRWKTVGIAVDPVGYEELYNQAGLIAPKEGVYRTGSLSLYDGDFNADSGASYVGYVTSFMFSPILKRHIGLAKVPLDRAAPGNEVYLELTVSHRPRYVRAEVARIPFYNPGRKTAAHDQRAS